MTRRHEDLLQQARLIQPADAMAMLQADHRRIHKLFQWYTTTHDQGMQPRIVLALLVALEVYIQLEDHMFYPALAEATPRAAHGLVETGLEAHTQIEVAIEALRGLAVNAAAFAATFHALRLMVEQHIAYEERQLLPHAEVVLAGQLEDLRDEMQAVKEDLLGSTVEGIAEAVAVLPCLGRRTPCAPSWHSETDPVIRRYAAACARRVLLFGTSARVLCGVIDRVSGPC